MHDVKRRQAVRWGFLIPSVSLYSFCLMTTAFCTDGCIPSLTVALSGWLPTSYLQLMEWFANPLLIVGWLTWITGLYRATNFLSVIALSAALMFLFQDGAITGEDGVARKITEIGPGYWLWIASMVVLTVGSAIELTGRFR